MKNILSFLLILLVVSSCTDKNKNQVWLTQAPAGSQITKTDKEGKTVIPNGRFITPAGKSFVTAPHPYGLTLSNDGTIAVTANSGTNPLSITIIRNLQSDSVTIQQIPPGANTDGDVLGSVFMGLVISPDNKTVYVSGGETNQIYLFNVHTGDSLGIIDCSFVSDSVNYSDGYIGDMVLSKDGKRLYAVDQIGFRMVIIDTEKRKLIHSVPVGRYPFGIQLSPDEKRIYVANVGMFQYGWIKSADSNKITPLDFPAFAYGSKEMKEGIENDTIVIPALGNPNHIDAFSLFTIDLQNPDNPKVVAKTKTGHLVGSMGEAFPAVGGSSPNLCIKHI
jgi:YVTN family beta-propeller protein